MIRALAAVGRQAEALAVYQRTRDQLAEDLGVDPSKQLAQAYLAVLRQEVPVAIGAVGAAGAAGAAGDGRGGGDDATAAPSAAPTAGRTLNVGPRARRGWRQPTSFVGRDCDVAAVLKQLAAERLVTLTGPGGVGKTRLAAEAAERLAGAGSAWFAGPAWFAALAPVAEPSEVPHAVLDALGLRERSIARRGSDGGADPVDRLCAALAERNALLILDNCEHVIEPAALLAARLLADCPGVRILATSREPLRIGGESLYVVAPLPVPPAADPAAEPSTPRPAVRPRLIRTHSRPCACSAIGRPPCCPTSSSTRARPGRWRRSAGRSTACRSRSSWRCRGSAR